MKTILILIILLALLVSASWAQIVDGDGIPLDTCTEEEAVAILKAFGDYKSPDTLTHYQVIDTTVDSTMYWRYYDSPSFDVIKIDSIWIKDTTIDTTRHKKIMERGEHFIPIIFINTPGLIGCADTIWVDTTDPKTYLRVTTSGQPLNRFYGTGIENDWKYEITIEMITDGIERGGGYALQFKGYDDPAPDSFGIFDTDFKKADEKFKNSGDSIVPIKEYKSWRR